MLNIEKDSIIYIFAPHNYISGGPEALHQLCDCINRQGGDSRMIYLTGSKEPISDKAPEKFNHLKLKFDVTVQDSSKNVVITPEVWPELARYYRHTKNCIWWLGVNANPEHRLHMDSIWNRDDILHLYQSHYAYQHLLNHGVTYMMYLSDYVHPHNFYNKEIAKEPIVCYNGAGGMRQDTLDLVTTLATKKLPVKFCKIQNMSHTQVFDTLSKAAIYLEFGLNPGKEKLAREAIANNCCVIFRKNIGCTNHFVDTPSLQRYKYDLNDLDGISGAIVDIVRNYYTRIADFKLYKRILLAEKQQMELDVQKLFIYKQ